MIEKYFCVFIKLPEQNVFSLLNHYETREEAESHLTKGEDQIGELSIIELSEIKDQIII